MARRETRNPVAGTAALSKGIQVLLLLGEEGQPMRFAELAARLGLAKGTLHRILAALGRFDLVRYDPNGQVYVLGPRLLALAHSVWAGLDVRGVAVAELARLVAETGEMACLAQLDFPDSLVIEQRDTDHALGVRLSVGRRDPAFCTAAGKILLAYQTPERQQQLLDKIRFEKLTAFTITDPEAFRAELELCRARGYAICDQEQITGVRAVAAPIFSPRGDPVTSVFVTGPTVRLNADRLHVIGRDLMKTAHRITGNMGGTALHVDTPQAPQAPSIGVELLLEQQALLGDSPYWSVRDRLLYWTDILAPSVGRLDLATGKTEFRPMRELVGFVLDRTSGGQVVTTQHGLMAWDFDTGEMSLLATPATEAPDNRFNDGKCDRLGRLFAGTMSIDAAPERGSLYRLDENRHLERVMDRITISNGLAWSPNNKILYFVDSGIHTIYACRYDPETGAVLERQEFFRSSPEIGRPSGITVDREGGIWCAMWDGWSVVRLSPEGKIDRIVYLPVPRPASCSFAGDDLDLLVISSARIRLSEQSLNEAPLSGSIFALRPGLNGLPETPFAG